MKIAVYSNMAGLQMADSFAFSKDHDDPTNSIKNCSAYDDFLEHIDSQLNSLGYEIEQFIGSQLAEVVKTQKPINVKRHKLSDILKLVTETRERIAKILDNRISETGSEDLRW